jgi:hypothetical protein
MLIKRLATTSIAGACLLLSQSYAVASPFNFGSIHEETRAYVGLNWQWGQTGFAKPNLVLGARKTTTDLNDKVSGFDLSLSYSLEKSKAEGFRAGYLDGKCDLMATAGLGYSFLKAAPLAYAGVLGPYSKLLVEVDGNKKMGLNLEINSLHCAGNHNSQLPT